jgi:hypothetical protein
MGVTWSTPGVYHECTGGSDIQCYVDSWLASRSFHLRPRAKGNESRERGSDL